MRKFIILIFFFHKLLNIFSQLWFINKIQEHSLFFIFVIFTKYLICFLMFIIIAIIIIIIQY